MRLPSPLLPVLLKSKLRHIEAGQDSVQALRDAELVKLVKVNTKDNFADLMAKILDPETFTNLQHSMLVDVAIPDLVIEQSSTSSSAGVSGGTANAAGQAGPQEASEEADNALSTTGSGSEEAKRR